MLQLLQPCLVQPIMLDVSCREIFVLFHSYSRRICMLPTRYHPALLNLVWQMQKNALSLYLIKKIFLYLISFSWCPFVASYLCNKEYPNLRYTSIVDCLFT